MTSRFICQALNFYFGSAVRYSNSVLLLVTYHELRWTEDQDVNKKEIEALYSGRVHSSYDLEIFE